MQLQLSAEEPDPLDFLRNNEPLRQAIAKAMPRGDYQRILRSEMSFAPPTAPGFDSWSYRFQFLAEATYVLGYRYHHEKNQPRLLAPPVDGIQATFVVVTGEVEASHVIMGDKGIVTRRFIRANHSWDPHGQTQMFEDESANDNPDLLRALNVMIVSRCDGFGKLHTYAVVPSRIIKAGVFYCCDSELIDVYDMGTYVPDLTRQSKAESLPNIFILPENPDIQEFPQDLELPEQDDQTGTDE